MINEAEIKQNFILILNGSSAVKNIGIIIIKYF